MLSEKQKDSRESTRKEEREGTTLVGATSDGASAPGIGEDDIDRIMRESWYRSAVPAAMLGPKGHLTRANDAFLQSWGYGGAKEIEGTHCSELWALGSMLPKINAGLLSDKFWMGEVEGIRKSGERFGLEVLALPLLGGGTAVLGFMIISIEHHHRPRMEARLLQSERLAAVGQLAAGVAHEINNPAAFVMTNLGQVTKYVSRLMIFLGEVRRAARETGLTELDEKIGNLESEHDIIYIEEDMDDLINESLEGMIRIRNIVADLRKFSAMRSNEVGEIAVNDMVESTINLAWSEIKLKGRVIREMGPVPYIRGVQGRLANALLNVLVNAAQSMDEADMENNTVTVSTGVRDNRIFIRVADTGRGMDAETLARVFDPFFTTQPAGEGTGLGLTISQDIVRRCGGEISAESEPGKGSVFTLWLPAGVKGEDIRMSKPAGDKKLEEKPKIMVIDDEQPVLKAIMRLTQGAYEVTAVSSAEEALKILETDRGFRVILCDLVMPGQNGQYLYNETIKRWPELEEAFIFFTGGAYTKDLRGFYNLMKHRTIDKPLKGEEILDAIEERAHGRG